MSYLTRVGFFSFFCGGGGLLLSAAFLFVCFVFCFLILVAPLVEVVLVNKVLWNQVVPAQRRNQASEPLETGMIRII